MRVELKTIAVETDEEMDIVTLSKIAMVLERHKSAYHESELKEAFKELDEIVS